MICIESTAYDIINDNSAVRKLDNSQAIMLFYVDSDKAVVAGPAGRRAPDHFFGRECFPSCPFFLVLAHFSFSINNTRCMSSIDRPSQGVKTLKNNAIIILMGRVERKPDVVAFED